MSSREVPEWQGRTPNTAIPPRVHDRVRKAHPNCVLCGLPILPTEKTETHHFVALINGGSHSEKNLRPVHIKCHRIQTKKDVAEKAAVAKKRQGVRGMGQKTKAKIVQRAPAEKPEKPVKGDVFAGLPRRSLFQRRSI